MATLNKHKIISTCMQCIQLQWSLILLHLFQGIWIFIHKYMNMYINFSYTILVTNLLQPPPPPPPHTPISTKQKNPNQTFMILYHNSLVLKWSNIFYWLNNSPVFMNKYHNDIWKVNPCNKHNLIDS